MQWCTTSDPEQQKCSDMSKAFQRAGIQPSLLCIQGTSADHCIQLITVSPLPSALAPPPARQEGSDSEGSTQQPHSLGKAPMSPLERWVIGSPEFPRQQGPACFLHRPRPGPGRPQSGRLLRWAPAQMGAGGGRYLRGRGFRPRGPWDSGDTAHPSEGCPDSILLGGPWGSLCAMEFSRTGFVSFLEKKEEGPAALGG